MNHPHHSRPSATRGTAEPRLALASRGDALTPYLFRALERRFPVVGRIDPELTPAQRYLVAGLTFRPDRSRWVERFYKSGTARDLRSGNADRQFRALPEVPDAVVQVHLLFDVPAAPSVIYVDCTHRQSADQWPDWNPLRGRALERWYRAERAAYTSARHLFAFSEVTRESLLVDYGVAPERVTVVGGGINLDELPPRRRGVAQDGPPTVLFVGNDFVRKGGHVLLEAFRAVRSELPEARLQLVGTRPSVEPEPGVEVLGRVHDRARVASLYAGASVFALPSYFDPYPLVVLEAMAFGLPVVGTRQMAVSDLIADGETGRLVEPGHADQLAEALLHVLRNPERGAAWGAAGRERVEQHFTWDAVVDRMTPALRALTAGPGR